MVTLKVKLRKRVIFLTSVFLVIAIGFISASIYQWSKLANEEYFYDNPKNLYKKLGKLPSNLNIENVKRIQTSINPSRFKFILIGDSHGNHKILNRVIKKALLHKPDFIVHLGDLTKQGKLRHYVKELNFIKKNVPCPFILVVGNHDYYNNGFISYAHIFGPLDFYFDIGKYRFICIDNNFIEKVEKFVYLPDYDMEWEEITGVDEEKMALLDLFLKEESRVNIILLHQPPPLDRWEHHAFKDNGKEFIDLIEKYNTKVPYVCSGHIHGYDKKELAGTGFIISGGAGGRFRKGIDDAITKRHNYVLFEVDESGIKDKVYFID